jgi:hypothetical protein
MKYKHRKKPARRAGDLSRFFLPQKAKKKNAGAQTWGMELGLP